MYYAANNQKIADKKKADYREGLEKSRADSAARSCESYLKDPEKSHARSRNNYKKDLKKSRDDSAVRRRESYLTDPEKSHARVCENYMKDPEKSCADSAAQSKANYSKDVKASRTLKRQRYVMLCVCSLNYLGALSRYSLKPPNNSEVENYVDKVFDEIFKKISTEIQ